MKEILNWDGSKATASGDISVNIFKSTVDVHFPYITNINLSIQGYFPDELRFAEVSPVFRKEDDLDKKNYTTDLPLFYLICQRSLKESYIIN